MFHTVIEESPALKSGNAKQAVAKGYAAAKKGRRVQIYEDTETGTMLSQTAMTLLQNRLNKLSEKPAAAEAEMKNIDLHNALEELALLAHQYAPIVLKRDLTDQEHDELTRLGDQVNNFLYV